MPPFSQANGKDYLADRKAYRQDRVLMRAGLAMMTVFFIALGFVTAAGIQIIG